MKTAVIVAVVSALVSLSYGAPAPNEIDWYGIATRVRWVEHTIATSFRFINEIASMDDQVDPRFPPKIALKLHAKAVEAAEVIAEIRAGIGKMNEEAARFLFAKLYIVLQTISGDMAYELSRFKPKIQADINASLNVNRSYAEEMANEIYEILRRQ